MYETFNNVRGLVVLAHLQLCSFHVFFCAGSEFVFFGKNGADGNSSGLMLPNKALRFHSDLKQLVPVLLR